MSNNSNSNNVKGNTTMNKKVKATAEKDRSISSIVRQTFESHATLPIGYRYFPDSVLIDRRFATRYADELLSEAINIEYVARECAKRSVRSVVVKALGNDTLGRVFRDMHKTPMVELEVPVYNKADFLTAIGAAVGAGSSGEAAVAAAVLTEIMLHVLRPLAIVDRTDEGYAVVTTHMSFFPTYEDLVTDIWAREIEKTLNESRRLDVGTGKRKLGVSILAARLARVGRDLRECVEYVGDYAAYAADAMVLVKANLLPRTTRAAGAPFFPTDLVDHPVIKAMAANLTIANIALTDVTIGNELKTTAFLMERLAQVAAFFFESKRYVKVSLSDFKQHFTKSSFATLIDQRTFGGVISYNLRGAPAAQAVTVADSILVPGTFYVDPKDHTTKAIAAHYGQLMNRIDTQAVHNLYRSIYENMYQSGEISADEPYLDALLPVEMQPALVPLMESLAVAICICGEGEVYVCEMGGSEDMRNEQLADRFFANTPYRLQYSVPGELNYIPESGNRMQDHMRLMDPFEVVMVAPAWEGTTYLADKLQVVPDTVLKRHTLGDPQLGLAAVRGFATMSVEVNGTTLNGGFQFVGNGIRSSERDAMVVKPVLNAMVAASSMDIVQQLLILLNSVEDRARRVQLKRGVFAFLQLAVTQGIGETTVAPYKKDIENQCMSAAKAQLLEEGPANDEQVLRQLRRIQALLAEKAVDRCMNLFILEQVMQILGLLESQASQASRQSTLFNNLRNDPDFALILTGLSN